VARAPPAARIMRRSSLFVTTKDARHFNEGKPRRQARPSALSSPHSPLLHKQQLALRAL
jgi:hypothetical protein